jgi:hypothetical protein
MISTEPHAQAVEEVFDEYGIRLTNFVVEAYSLLGDLTDKYPSADEIAEHLDEAAKQKREILAFLPKVLAVKFFKDSLGFVHPDQLTNYLDRTCELLLVWVEKKQAEDELRLFLGAIERAAEHAVYNLAARILDRPRKSVQWFARAIDQLEFDAQVAANFSYHSSSWVGALELATTAWVIFNASFSFVVRFMDHGIDRWIYPRAGTNPDEWTTRLSQRLKSLKRELGVYQSMHLTEGAEGVFSENVERIEQLCYELSRMAEELRALRFDVEDPFFKPEEENTPETSSGSDQVTEAAPSRICRLKADIDATQVWLDDVPFLVPRRSAIYLQAVLENEHDVPLKPISGRAIQERYPEFPQNKVSEYRQKLPPPIRELIDTSGNGSCLKPNAYKNPEKPDATR